jgi:hypothetical protein
VSSPEGAAGGKPPRVKRPKVTPPPLEATPDGAKNEEANYSEATKKALKDAAELASLDLSNPKTAQFIGEMLAQQEELFYSVLARGIDDPRWKLLPEEVEAQKSLLTMTCLVYGNLIKTWVVPFILVGGLASPVVARVLFLPPKDKNNLGGPGGGGAGPSASDGAKPKEGG